MRTRLGRPPCPEPTSHPMKKDFVIKILFVENSLEEAEQIISLMRNSGIAVRPARATNIEQVRSAVAELEPDVVMFDPSVTDVGLDETMGVMEASGRDFALVGLVTNMDSELVADLFVHGARGVASRNHPKQLIAVLKREFESLHTRRQVRWLHTALRETERRCDALLDSSTDAIAYVHEGMHVRANQAYLDTFGYESFDDLLGMPLLDMIDSANAEEMKALLRGQAHQGKFPAQLPLRARRADDSRFDATVEFAPATFEGEREGEPDIYRMLLERRIDVVTFTSASAVRSFVKLLGAEPAADLLGKTVVASIGPVTAEAAAQYNVTTTIMPSQFTIPALVDAIVEYYATVARQEVQS